MKNPLRSLDELICNQFEKITTKANTSLGLNKYDLMEKTANLGTLSSIGLLFQMFYQVSNTQSKKGDISSFEVFGQIMFAGLILRQSYFLFKGNEEERKDIEKQETGESVPQPITEPTLYALRPLGLAAASLPLMLTGAISLYQPLTEIKDLYAVAGITLFSAWPTFHIFSEYFKSQKTPYLKTERIETNNLTTSS